MFDSLYLTPFTGTMIVFLVVICGHCYRRVWKTEPENARLKAWLYGVPAAIGLMALAFLPLKF